MIKAMNTIMKERFLTNRVADQFFSAFASRPASEIGCQPLHPDTGARLHDEPNLHLEFYRRTVADGMHPLPFLLMWFRISQKVVTVAKKIENSVQPVIGSCFHSSAIKNVDHEAWRARTELFRDCDKYIECKLSTFTSRRKSGRLFNE